MSAIDYSKFDHIGEEEEQEEAELRAKSRETREAALRRRHGGRLPAKYVDSDGETVSEPSDDEDEGMSKMKKEMENMDYGDKPVGEYDGEDDSDSDDEDLHPLFWTKMPKPGSKQEGAAQVLKDLVYKNENDEDKSPNELAVDFKEKGNDFFKWGVKFYRRALKEYKEALMWARKGDGNDDNRKCYAAILSNRAAINIKFKNYGSVIKDCEAAIKFGPDPLPNAKPFYRAGFASFELGKYKQALAFAKKGLELEPETELLKELKAKAHKKVEAQKREKIARERVEAQERKLDEEMRKACVARGITMGPLVSDIEVYLANMVGNKTKGGFPRPTYLEGSMQWSALLMFPETMQTDFIMSFDLRHRFRDHLEMMFPMSLADNCSEKRAPWDTNFDYTLDALAIYFEERQGDAFDMTKMWANQYGKKSDKEDYSKKLRVKVGLDKTLQDAITDPAYIVPGLPTFYVVSTRSDYFKETFEPHHDGRLRIL
mmetsp:Transcript_18243/g.33740  ORF Transcript_18243/g.33740 Transcript_18243/m.33740 type:complete len:486 (-) Transcript_18243:219-1676(-)|eukprot:CAMPEP_0184523592 /NCGR_PEP_ID=MMETSP0198_2-20121128/8976_1 /TAXON_ID=1112570 /ORGANISM="Thraustochytrium sp., Strain LLF1b" /LENGTH=485 /DNA_ID=CAMNT_0026914653 /DNA_START=126 /DNA_END=1583 /DNA_ORIENTATION=-